MPPEKNPGLALKWLKEAAEKCDRVPDDAELKRLLSWAGAKIGTGERDDDYSHEKVEIDIDHIFELVVAGLHQSRIPRALASAALRRARSVHRNGTRRLGPIRWRARPLGVPRRGR